MSENLVVNGVTYNGVDHLEMQNNSGETVQYYADAVRYVEQELTESQQAQARENIGATASEVFTAQYGSTTYEQISAAIDAGKVCRCLKTGNDSQIGFLFIDGRKDVDALGHTFSHYDAKRRCLTNWYVTSGNSWNAIAHPVVSKINGIYPTNAGNTNTDGNVVLPAVYYEAQTLTEEQKKQARENVGAAARTDPTAFGLPVLALTGDASAMTKDNAVSLGYRFQDRSGNCDVKWQGSSSLSYPKKNYTINFDAAFEAKEGWGEQEKYCAKANFIDHSHARNVVSAKLWGGLVKSRVSVVGLFGPEELNGFAAQFIESDGTVYVNENWRTSGYKAIPTADKLYVSFTSNTLFKNFNVAFYDENKAFLSRNLWAWTFEDGNYLLDTNITIPSGTKYIRFGYSLLMYQGATTPDAVIDLDTMWVGTAGRSSLAQLAQLPNGGAIDGFPIVITINGEFNGLYTFNIPKDGWVLGLQDSAAQQAIVCANEHTAATQFKSAALLDGSDFELEYVSDEHDTNWVLASLNTLINAVRNSNGTDLDTTIARYLDWDSAIDYYLFCVLTNHMDGLDKNYILATHDGVKWFFSGYDLDATFGLFWDGTEFYPANGGVNVDSYASLHKVMELVKTYKADALKARYEELRAATMSEERVDFLFTTFAAGISSVVRYEDARKWPSIPSTTANNVHQILNWYRLRVGIADKQIEAM